MSKLQNGKPFVNPTESPLFFAYILTFHSYLAVGNVDKAIQSLAKKGDGIALEAGITTSLIYRG